MRREYTYIRLCVCFFIIAYLNLYFTPELVWGQSEYCIYDRKAPSLESALESYKLNDYECARWELKDLLDREDITRLERADALILLAQVNFFMINDSQTKRSEVRKDLITAFRTYPEWNGELQTRNTEFIKLIRDSRDIADRLGPFERIVTELDSLEAPFPPQKAPKAWYKKWWIYGTGVGLMAAAIVLLGGGDDDKPAEPLPVLDTLAGFPPSPGGNDEE